MSTDQQNQIDSTLMAIKSLATIGASLFDSTRVTNDQIAVLFEVIEEKTDRLYKLANGIKGNTA